MKRLSKPAKNQQDKLPVVMPPPKDELRDPSGHPIHPVVAMLASLQLQGYAREFIEVHKFDTLESIAKFVTSEDDLVEIGVKPLAHRRALWTTISKMRTKWIGEGQTSSVAKKQSKLMEVSPSDAARDLQGLHPPSSRFSQTLTRFAHCDHADALPLTAADGPFAAYVKHVTSSGRPTVRLMGETSSTALTPPIVLSASSQPYQLQLPSQFSPRSSRKRSRDCDTPVGERNAEGGLLLDEAREAVMRMERNHYLWCTELIASLRSEIDELVKDARVSFEELEARRQRSLDEIESLYLHPMAMTEADSDIRLDTLMKAVFKSGDESMERLPLLRGIDCTIHVNESWWEDDKQVCSEEFIDPMLPLQHNSRHDTDQDGKTQDAPGCRLACNNDSLTENLSPPLGVPTVGAHTSATSHGVPSAQRPPLSQQTAPSPSPQVVGNNALREDRDESCNAVMPIPLSSCDRRQLSRLDGGASKSSKRVEEWFDDVAMSVNHVNVVSANLDESCTPIQNISAATAAVGAPGHNTPVVISSADTCVQGRSASKRRVVAVGSYDIYEIVSSSSEADSAESAREASAPPVVEPVFSRDDGTTLDHISYSQQAEVGEATLALTQRPQKEIVDVETFEFSSDESQPQELYDEISHLDDCTSFTEADMLGYGLFTDDMMMMAHDQHSTSTTSNVAGSLVAAHPSDDEELALIRQKTNSLLFPDDSSNSVPPAAPSLRCPPRCPPPLSCRGAEGAPGPDDSRGSVQWFWNLGIVQALDQAQPAFHKQYSIERIESQSLPELLDTCHKFGVLPNSCRREKEGDEDWFRAMRKDNKRTFVVPVDKDLSPDESSCCSSMVSSSRAKTSTTRGMVLMSQVVDCDEFSCSSFATSSVAEVSVSAKEGAEDVTLAAAARSALRTLHCRSVFYHEVLRSVMSHVPSVNGVAYERQSGKKTQQPRTPQPTQDSAAPDDDALATECIVAALCAEALASQFLVSADASYYRTAVGEPIRWCPQSIDGDEMSTYQKILIREGVFIDDVMKIVVKEHPKMTKSKVEGLLKASGIPMLVPKDSPLWKRRSNYFTNKFTKFSNKAGH